jgi:hypothetical protein
LQNWHIFYHNVSKQAVSSICCSFSDKTWLVKIKMPNACFSFWARQPNQQHISLLKSIINLQAKLQLTRMPIITYSHASTAPADSASASSVALCGECMLVSMCKIGLLF